MDRVVAGQPFYFPAVIVTTNAMRFTGSASEPKRGTIVGWHSFSLVCPYCSSSDGTWEWFGGVGEGIVSAMTIGLATTSRTLSTRCDTCGKAYTVNYCMSDISYTKEEDG